MKRGLSKYAILGVLSLGPSSGYDIKKLLDMSVSHFWRESYGNIYPLLDRLHSDGLVTRRTDEAKAGRPNRFEYSLTETGRSKLTTWLEDPAGGEKLQSEFLLKLFFGHLSPPEVVVTQLQQYLASQRQTLAVLDDIASRLAEDLEGAPQIPFWMMTIRRGQLVADTRIRWTEECISKLTRLNK